MKTIYWKESGASVEVVKAVNEGIPFVVIVEGVLARAFVATFGISRVGITPEQGRVIIAVVAILAVSGLVFFALANGYKISGKGRGPDGSEYEITFEPKPKT